MVVVVDMNPFEFHFLTSQYEGKCCKIHYED